MIQRIQTVFLLIASGMITAMFFLPLASFLIDDKIYFFSYRAIVSDNNDILFHTYSLAFLLTFILITIVATIFFYKKRKLQMRFCLYNILLNIGFYGLFYFYYHQIVMIKQLIYSFEIASVFPVIIIVLLWLAFRSIRKDEELVKSVDRIR